MNIHAAAAYAAHLLTSRSTAGHGVHSPLMFRFITEVIGGRADRHIIKEVRRLRKEMLTDNRVVKVTDLGAGSTVLGGRERRIRQIASAAALPAREVALLARIAASLDIILERVQDYKVCGSQPNGWPSQGFEPTGRPANNPENTPPEELLQPENRPVILELGTSLGISTLALAMAAPDRRVITVEGCPELAAIARENLLRHGVKNAEVMNMEFSQALSQLKSVGTKVRMAFIDGNHRGAALIDYAHRIMEMGDDLIIMADDIHLNIDMIRAWNSLCNRQQTHRPDGSTGILTGQRQAPDIAAEQSPLTRTYINPGVIRHFISSASTGSAMTSLETYRLGILFCLQNLTPGHYRIRY